MQKKIAYNTFYFILTILSFGVNTLILRLKENHSIFIGLDWNQPVLPIWENWWVQTIKLQ